MIATEELRPSTPGFPTILLVNGLALMRSLVGTEQPMREWIGAATRAGNTEFLGGWVVSERGGTANIRPSGPSARYPVVADTTGNREFVLNGKSTGPATRADGTSTRGAQRLHRADRPDQGGTEALSAIIVERGTPGIDYQVIDKIGHRTCQNVTMRFTTSACPRKPVRGGQRGPGHQPQLHLVRPDRRHRGGRDGRVPTTRLKWARPTPGCRIIPDHHHQAVGHLLAEVAPKIEAARYSVGRPPITWICTRAGPRRSAA